jgi:hypothetical protein
MFDMRVNTVTLKAFKVFFADVSANKHPIKGNKIIISGWLNIILSP